MNPENKVKYRINQKQREKYDKSLTEGTLQKNKTKGEKKNCLLKDIKSCLIRWHKIMKHDIQIKLTSIAGI